MDQGKVVEFGPPLKLLGEGEKNENGTDQPNCLITGVFHSLVNELGAERRERFINIAKKKL